MQWGKSGNPNAGKGQIANVLASWKSVCFLEAHTYWKGNCAQLQVRNVRGVAKKAILQSSVETSPKMQKFTWSNKKSSTSIVLGVKIKLLFRSLWMIQHHWHFKLTLVPLQIFCHCRITSEQRKSHWLCTITRRKRLLVLVPGVDTPVNNVVAAPKIEWVVS